MISGADEATNPVRPSDLGVAEPGVVAHVADPERARLRAQAALLGGRSTLLFYEDSPERGIDINKAHPGSLPQFLTGRSTLLSNLYRDEVALRTARMAVGGQHGLWRNLPKHYVVMPVLMQHGAHGFGGVLL